MEPTLGTRGRCLEDLGLLDREEALALHAALYVREFEYYRFTLLEEDGFRVGLIARSGLDCVEAVAVEVEGCGGGRERVLGITDWPEVSRVEVEGGCVRALVPAEPPYRVVAALRRLGALGRPPLRVEPLDAEEVEERLGGEVQGPGLA